MMKLYKDNEIEVLGAKYLEYKEPQKSEAVDESQKPLVHEQPVARKKYWPMLLLIAIALVILMALLYLCVNVPPSSPKQDVVAEVIQTEIAAPAQPIRKMQPIVAEEDSINDVAFTLYPVDSLKASVSFQMPDATDSNLIIVTPAADYRADGKGIVGDFIMDKQQRARGERKEGWCRISPEGALSIGIGDAESIKQEVLNNGGIFFRQYALVMDGEICPNVLKGKAKRRAIGFLDGKPVLVKSHERESIYDFSQALADYGFSHALYLPGGEGLWLCRDKNGLTLINDYPASSPDANYLVFSLE